MAVEFIAEKHKAIKGTLFWTRWLTQYNTAFNEDNDRYEMTLGNLSDEAADYFKSIGVKVKEKEGQGKYVVAKSKKGFMPVNSEGDQIDPTTLGAGTQVVVLANAYATKMSKQYGNSVSVNAKFKVTKLIEYAQGGDFGGDDDDTL